MKRDNARFDPIFRNDVFTKNTSDAISSCVIPETMTVNGVVLKTFTSIVLLLISAAFAWKHPPSNIEAMSGKIIVFSILAFILCIVSMNNANISKITVPLYAIIEGFLIGTISYIIEKFAPGTVIQAILSTIGVLCTMLILYKTEIIKPTRKFAIVIFTSTLAIAITYLISMIMSVFGFNGLSFLHSNSLFGIAVSAFICIIASLNLIFDFDFITKQIEASAPKKMEWIATLGLLVTLIWIYVEILNLLAKLNSRD